MGQSKPFTESQKIIGNYEPGEGPGPRMLSAESFEGEEVVDRNRDKVGEITNIMIDVPSGRIAYAVLSIGGILGMGGSTACRALERTDTGRREQAHHHQCRCKAAQGCARIRQGSLAKHGRRIVGQITA